MKIVLTGQAGTDCNNVALKLANRLALDCITAKSFFPSTCFDKTGALKPEYRLHEDSWIDQNVDDELYNEVMRHDEDFLLCSYNGMFIVPDAIRILLVSDVQVKPSLAKYVPYREADESCAFKGAFNESNYDIVVNVFNSTIDDIVNCLVNSLGSGRHGKYVPIELMLPSRVDDIGTCNYYDTDVELYTYEGCKFIKSKSMCVVLSCARAGVRLVRVKETPVIDFLKLSRDDYIKWFERIGVDPTDALNYLTVALYCFTFGYFDSEQVFCNLCKTGNPYKRMEAEGITIE